MSDFSHAYLQTWTEPDPALRRVNSERVWATDGRLAISSLGITLTGVDEIVAHISRVHNDLIAAKGLRFSYDQEAAAGDALLLRWSMTASDGGVVGRGADVVFRDDTGRVVAAYMFMGVA